MQGLHTLRRLLLSSAALTGLALSTSAQTTWYVDDDGPGDPLPGVSVPGNPAFSDPIEDGSAAHPFDDLYKAVNAATNGDEILVLPSNVSGSYPLSSQLNLLGKQITIRSTDGPEVTALTGASLPNYGILVNGDSTLEGLTFSNFNPGPGGGAGAMYIYVCSPTIRNCVFTEGDAYLGGGIRTYYSDPLIEHCRFESNTAFHQGGAIYVEAGDPLIRHCTFEDNEAGYGGAILIRSFSTSLTRIQDCLFRANRSTIAYTGAVAKFDSGRVIVDRCRFLANEAINEGSAVLLSGPGTVRNSLFDGNVCSAGNGTILVRSGSVVTIAGCTLVDNTGGGVVAFGSAQTTLRNSIVRGNGVELTNVTDVGYCNVLGGSPGIGNLDADPAFRDRNGADGLPGTIDDDLSILRGSPCVDAGETLAVESPLDLNGNPRVFGVKGVADVGTSTLGQAVDIGCHEFVHRFAPLRSQAPGPLGSRP